MVHSDLRRLAAAQDDAVAVWQLVRRGWTTKQIECRTAGYKRVFDGVVLLTASEPTKRQRLRAATLTTPDSVLSHASAGDHAGFRPAPRDMRLTIIARPGDGGPEEFDDLLVTRSTVLHPDVITLREGLPTTTPERTLLDLAGSRHFGETDLRKSTREAIRMKLVTCASLIRACDKHPRRRGTSRVRTLAERYAHLGIERANSPAESLAMELIDEWKFPLPRLNHTVARAEGDLYFDELGLVIELHGPQWHRLRDGDARKERAWRAAGLQVRHMHTDDVFDRPEVLRAHILDHMRR